MTDEQLRNSLFERIIKSAQIGSIEESHMSDDLKQSLQREELSTHARIIEIEDKLKPINDEFKAELVALVKKYILKARLLEAEAELLAPDTELVGGSNAYLYVLQHGLAEFGWTIDGVLEDE